MRLRELAEYKKITIQCHDNPDADTLGCAYALFRYFTDNGCTVKIVYGGKNKIKKANLKLLVEQLKMPVEHIKGSDYYVDEEGLLLTVDCQFGAGNVTMIPAEHVAVIDHHPKEISDDISMYNIKPNLGSCATLVWSMLMDEGYPINDSIEISTALYYGLYTDTNQLSEVFNPIDFDMRDSLSFNRRLITRLTNANLSLKELEIAGIAMIRYNYNDDYRFAVIKSKPCDPNILGLISDFLTQVAEIDTCVVYNEINDGYKFSVRSCVREVRANELAVFLSKGIGSGGGHDDKAGGFISMRRYEEQFPTTHSEAYFNNRITQYFDSFKIIYSAKAKVKKSDMKLYARKKEPIYGLNLTELVGESKHISIRTQSGIWDVFTQKEMYLFIEKDGSIRIINQKRFDSCMVLTDKKPSRSYFGEENYMPTIKDVFADKLYSVMDYVNVYMPGDEFKIYAKCIEQPTKVFPLDEEAPYMLGEPGDYLAMSFNDSKNIFVEKAEAFFDRFEEI